MIRAFSMGFPQIADAVGAVVHALERAVDLVQEVANVVLDREVLLALERGRAGVRGLVVEAHVARQLGLGRGESVLLDRRELRLQLLRSCCRRTRRSSVSFFVSLVSAMVRGRVTDGPFASPRVAWLRGLVSTSGRGVSCGRGWGRVARFEPVDPKVRFPEMEGEILAFWREADVFDASLAQREGRPLDLLRRAADRERQARRAPRGVAHVQGRLPALQDDDRSLRPPQGRLGLSRPPGGAGGREGDRHHRQARHRGVRRRRVQSPVPRVGHALRR